MHEIEPYSGWKKYYQSNKDLRSPFFGRQYSEIYEQDIYGYFIDPNWDEINSETLFCKVQFVDYANSYCIIEMFGEWNDALNNDIMNFKSKVVDRFLRDGINKFILICENIFQYHAGSREYYEEWFEELENGWVAMVNLPEFLYQEYKRNRIDYYLNYGESFEILNWRTLKPEMLFKNVESNMRFLLN
jgi:hypothetical protein